MSLMPYCIRCGIKLPEDKEARFCPNCGAPLLRTQEYIGVKQETARSLSVPSQRSRLPLVLAILFLCILATSAGALSKVDGPKAQIIVEDFKEMEKAIQTVGIQLIFGNNMMYCLIMFIPFVGPISGFYVLYSTGKMLAAMGYVLGINPILLFLNLLFYPHAWLEYISYSLAISEGVWLSFHLLKHRSRGLKTEIINATRYIALCAILLLAGALIEMALINYSLFNPP